MKIYASSNRGNDFFVEATKEFAVFVNSVPNTNRAIIPLYYKFPWPPAPPHDISDGPKPAVPVADPISNFWLFSSVIWHTNLMLAIKEGLILSDLLLANKRRIC
jgi:hypothetical protein